MEAKKQSKARKAEAVRTETLTFRLDKQLRALAEIASRNKGVKLANYVEGALKQSLEAPVDLLGGASIAAKAEELFDDDDASCFLKRLRFPWSMSPEQKRLHDLLRTSKVLYPSWGSYNAVLIREYWTQLWAVAEGGDDPRALPSEIFEGVDIEFALMSDAERIALYQRDPAGCARRTEAYVQQTKRMVSEEVYQAMAAGSVGAK